LTAYIAVFLAAAVLYIASCAPGPLWQDSGMYQYRIWHNDIEGILGLALAHPLYLLIGIAVKYVPLGDFAYRVNLISAVAGAVAVANLFLLLRLWFGKNPPAVIAAMSFALSWTTWQSASIAEVYTLYLAIFLTELIMLFQYIKTRRISFLYLLAFFNGLAIADHNSAVIPLACYAVFWIVLLLKRQIRLSHLGVIIVLWIIGAAPYEYLIVKNIIQSGDFSAVLTSAFFGNGWQRAVLNTSISARLVKENLMFIAYNFPTPNVILFFAGLYGLKKLSPARSFRNILWAMSALFFVFAFRYTVPDRYAFFLPFYCLAAILIGVGFNLLVTSGHKTLACLVFIFALLPIPAYIFVPLAAQKMQLKLPTKREIPYRNDYTWFLQPWQTANHGPEQFAEEVFSSVPNDAVIYADGTTVYPLLYVQEIQNRHKDVRIISSHPKRQNPIVFDEKTIPQLLTQTSVYVVSPLPGYCPQFLIDGYAFKEAGILWKVVDYH